MTKQVYDNLKELEAVFKKLTCSIQQAFNIAKPVIYARWYKLENGDYWCPNCEGQNADATKFCPNCGARMDKE